MNSLSLASFTEPAMTVGAGLSLSEVCQRWQETLPETIVIVDEGQKPLGVVQGWRLALSLEREGTLADLAVGSVTASWRSPVMVVPATWTLLQFQGWLRSQVQMPAYIAVVDAQGCFLGLLDQQRLLYRWACQPPLPWLEVIEELPLPVQIQNAQGRVVWQNRAWSEHLTDFLPLVQPKFEGMNCQALEARSRSAPFGRSLWQVCSFPLNLTSLDWEKAESGVAVASDRYWLFFAQRRQESDPTTPTRLHQLRLHQQKRLLLSLGHELKNPLTAILSLTQLLWQHPLPEQQDYLALIQRSGWQMNRLIQAWQDHTRALWRELELQWETVELVGLWLRSQELAEHLYHLTPPGWQWQWHIDQSLSHVYLYGDALRLRQILAHLLGWLMLFPSDRYGLRLSRWQNWLALQLWEEGHGIPLKDHDRLLHECLEDYAEVTMGLMLARQLCRLHNGELSFIAQADDSSEWTVLLPFAEELPPELPTTAQLILLVSNDATWIMDTTSALQRSHYGYVVARHPLEALDKLEQLQPTAIVVRPASSLILADVVESLATSPFTATVPLIILSDEATPLGLTGFVQRLPLSSHPSLLIDVLDRWCFPRLAAPVEESTFERPLLNQTVLRLGLLHDISLPHLRLLEAEDLEQADLLVEIWQPDVLIWDLPADEVADLENHPKLRKLPMITLAEDSSRAIHQLGDVMVFPCLNLADLMDVVLLAATVKAQS
ncbi:histidine kinase dimerization/phospho-acceptor domain-containing protein [Thermosynechococcus sp. JY1334]|uniref:ATP-binding response regulator n=1 Tax=unclassified Thermosynechococcus TaxID=2622553 RepID=UPI002673202B|nr:MULTISPECIES: histidine kinase dimerization/phospho-acceptor domain-containing protein [unclassified Thermosynechococcus]MDR7897942.1 histidine kinase dimerization/phospho-acceptor domain-containing protein [Thermosynechococcus sp. JY1332]MDR7905341.1 histidine kinase dimerization/phospho-acceptor domain-containing protein [Thermosynechococcus sp. JY1334]WKT87553.1 histidine kinase dimerization/phospho-acceptor domain-containing protein [Thermosynechococcus sp. JY1339]WNC56492.1 histidine ki